MTDEYKSLIEYVENFEEINEEILEQRIRAYV